MQRKQELQITNKRKIKIKSINTKHRKEKKGTIVAEYLFFQII